jgi:hypothetical protein
LGRSAERYFWHVGASSKVQLKIWIVATSLTMVGCLIGAFPSSAATSSWPARYAATPIVWSAKYGDPKPLPFGSVYVPRTDMFAGITSQVYIGTTGWALGWNNARGTQYALVSHDHGRRWTTAGTYLSVSGAAGAAVNTIKAFSPNIVAAYDSGGGMNVFDITWNGGRTWNSAWVPGNLISVSNAVHEMDTSPAGVIQVVVGSLSRPTTYRLYASLNSGRTWTEGAKFDRGINI